jgi:uncharacterized protein YggE
MRVLLANTQVFTIKTVKKGGAKMNKTLVKQLLLFALVAVIAVACSPVQAAPLTATDSQVSRTITVVGIGKVRLAPDVTEIQVGAEAVADTVKEAKNQVDEKVAAILTTLKGLGIEEKDIQTSSYDIYYESEIYPPMESAPASKGVYHVSNMLRVTVRNVEQAGDVLDAAVEAGANRVYGVYFTVSDETQWESKARESAVADGKARAEELARLSGVKLGDILAVSEIVGSAPVFMPVALERAAGGGGIAPGEMEFSTQVQMTFAIQ